MAAGGTVVRGMRGGQGRPALLLHGTGGSWRNFEPWLPALLPRVSAVLPDLPGCGDSPAPPGLASLDRWSALLVEVVEALGVQPQVIAGLGLGASLALAQLQSTAEAASPPAKLLLYAPPVHPGAVRPLVRAAVRLGAAPPVFNLLRRLLRNPRVADWWLRRVVAGASAEQGTIAALRADLLRTDLAVLIQLARDAIGRDFRPLLAATSAHTLVLGGAADPLVDATQLQRLTALSARVHVVIQPNVGHDWPPEAVAEHQRLIAAFLDEP